MFSEFKSEIKLFLIVAVVSTVLAVGGILLLKMSSTPDGELVFSNECRQIEQEIDSLIQQANYCNVDSDCIVSAEAAHPALCWNLVNKNADVASIQQRTIRWQALDCGKGRVYEACARIPQSVKCEQNRCVGVYERSAQSDTSTWQTYRNEEFGFEFKYSPQEWQFMKGDSQENYGNIVWLFPRDSTGESSEPEIIVAIVYRSLEQEKKHRETTSGDLEYNYSKTTIGGRAAYSSALLPGFHGQVKEILMDAGNERTFIVSSNAIDELDQILSTFRFVEDINSNNQ